MSSRRFAFDGCRNQIRNFARDASFSDWNVIDEEVEFRAKDDAFHNDETSNLLCIISQIILHNARRSQLPDIDEKVYLIPEDWTVGQFVNLIRSKVRLCDEQAAEKPIYLYVNNMLLPPAAFVSTIYDHYRHVDGILYMAYSD